MPGAGGVGGWGGTDELIADAMTTGISSSLSRGGAEAATVLSSY